MNRPAFFIWLLAAPALAGVAITVLLSVESAEPALKTWILVAAVSAALIAAPIAWKVGKVMER